MNLDHKRNPPCITAISEWYADYGNAVGITFTLNPDFCKRRKMRNQLKISYPILNNLLVTHGDAHVVSCELTKQSNIHYHAIMIPKTIDWFHYFNDHMKDKKNNIFGIFKIEHKLSNIQNWVQYIFKDIDITYKLLNKTGSENLNVAHIKKYTDESNNVIKVTSINVIHTLNSAEITANYENNKRYLNFEI